MASRNLQVLMDGFHLSWIMTRRPLTSGISRTTPLQVNNSTRTHSPCTHNAEWIPHAFTYTCTRARARRHTWAVVCMKSFHGGAANRLLMPPNSSLCPHPRSIYPDRYFCSLGLPFSKSIWSARHLIQLYMRTRPRCLVPDGATVFARVWKLIRFISL